MIPANLYQGEVFCEAEVFGEVEVFGAAACGSGPGVVGDSAPHAPARIENMDMVARRFMMISIRVFEVRRLSRRVACEMAHHALKSHLRTALLRDNAAWTV
jgi:hypothetical protein